MTVALIGPNPIAADIEMIARMIIHLIIFILILELVLACQLIVAVKLIVAGQLTVAFELIEAVKLCIVTACLNIEFEFDNF